MAGPVYSADDPRERTEAALETLVAIYHAPSAMTHLLAPPAPEILEVLSDGPADLDAILARLKGRHELTGENLPEAIAARLQELEASGLVFCS